MKRPVLITLALIASFLAGLAVAAPIKHPVALKYGRALLDVDYANLTTGFVKEATHTDISSSLTAAARTPAAVPEIASMTVRDYYQAAGLSNTSPQKMQEVTVGRSLQLQVLAVQQNARIIELLERLAKK